jgi:outer membrane protein, heavy metal efflux system
MQSFVRGRTRAMAGAAVAVLAGVLAAGAAAEPPPPAGPLSLAAAVERALELHPGLRAARLRAAVAAADLAVAGERLNPEATYEVARETPRQSLTLALPLETGGKRARRIAVGEAAAGTVEAELAEAEVELRDAVRRAYFGRRIAEARLSLLEEVRTFSARARDAAEQRFEAGSAPRLEVLQARLALAEAENQANAALGGVTAARAQLNSLLALPPDAAPELTTTLDEGVAPPLDAALALARDASAELALLDRRIEEQRARVALARALQVPDLTPAAAVTWDAEPEFETGWRAALTVSVPLFSRHRAGVRLEDAALAQLVAERDAARQRITGEVTAAAALAAAQQEQYARYRDEILPQALEVERLAGDSYELGQTDVTALLQALRSSRDTRLQSLQAAADFQLALADFERAIGAPLP